MSVVMDMATGLFSALALILLCTAVEMVSQREEFRLSARWPGILFGALVPVFALLVMTPLQMLWAKVGVPPLVRLPIASLGVVGGALVLLLVQDFFAYWEHRFEHRFLWPVHAVHHSVEHLSAATSFSHPLQFVSIFFLMGVPMSLIDFGPFVSPQVVLVLAALHPLYIHSPLKVGLGPLRHLLVDPPHHRIHHSMEERHFDRNFSIMFSFWDRLFGTAVIPEPGQWPKVGIHEAASPRTLTELLAFPFRLWRKQPVVPAEEATTSLPPAPAEANRLAA